MMTTKAYVLTWLVYLLAAGGLMVVLYRLTRGWRPVAFRIVLRAVVGVWLLVPVVVEPGAVRETLAPAFMVLMFEWMGGYEQAERVLWPMLAITAAAVPAMLAIHWIWKRWRANRPLINVVKETPRDPGRRIEPTVGERSDP
ncbi:MAG: hypothetical protein ACOY3X_04060 [Pseudomonadota bacterium]